MSVMVMSFQAVEVAEWGDDVAKVIDDGSVVIYPQGFAVGPSITMTIEDWQRISQQVESAIVRHRSGR